MEKAGTGIELTKFLSLPKKKKKKKRGRRGRGGNDTNITIKLEGLSEVLINFEFPKESCVSTIGRRNTAKSLKQEKVSFSLTPSSEAS